MGLFGFKKTSVSEPSAAWDGQKWEYCTYRCKDFYNSQPIGNRKPFRDEYLDRELDYYGKQGWELVSTVFNASSDPVTNRQFGELIYTFKRPKQ